MSLIEFAFVTELPDDIEITLQLIMQIKIYNLLLLYMYFSIFNLLFTEITKRMKASVK